MPHKFTLSQFIERSKKIHGEKYDYSKVYYINSHKNVILICSFHGEFLQKPYCHLWGCGCPSCGGTKKLTAEEFIRRSKEIHGEKYDYSEVKYINNRKKVIIVCPKHGNFHQNPNGHLLGKGCPQCTGLVKLTIGDFIQRARNVHGDKYDYSKSKYVNSRTKLTIICSEHGEFSQKANSHLNGSGCSSCNHYVSKPETEFLDYIKVNERQQRLFGFNLDGIDTKNKIIFEFLGNYYHGNPAMYHFSDYNHKCNKTFGELYDDTFKKFIILKEKGYRVKYVWEKDWKDYKDGKATHPIILEF